MYLSEPVLKHMSAVFLEQFVTDWATVVEVQYRSLHIELFISDTNVEIN